MTPDAPRPDLDDAERRVRRYVEPPVVIGMQHVLLTLLAEYDRRGAALEDAQADLDCERAWNKALTQALENRNEEVARLRAALVEHWGASGSALRGITERVEGRGSVVRHCPCCGARARGGARQQR